MWIFLVLVAGLLYWLYAGSSRVVVPSAAEREAELDRRAALEAERDQGIMRNLSAIGNGGCKCEEPGASRSRFAQRAYGRWTGVVQCNGCNGAIQCDRDTPSEALEAAEELWDELTDQKIARASTARG